MMHKCICGFVLLFAVPLFAKPFVSGKALQTAPKPGVVRDREIEKVAKVKGWGSLTASPGDTIGSSQYDWQWNATPLRRVVYDPVLGNTHVTWMHQVPPSERHMFYNFNNGASWSFGTGRGGGTAIQTSMRDGYGTIDYTTDGCAVVSFHKGATEAEYKSCVCVDLMAGEGGFDCVDLPDPPAGEFKLIWPRVAVDGSNNMIVVTWTDSVVGQPGEDPTPRNYSRSTDGAGATWSDWIPFDTGNGLSGNIFASKSSNKFCMVWGKNFLENGSHNGHIVYKESNDAGAAWGNLVDITALIPLPTVGRTYTPLQLRNCTGNTYGIYDSDDNIRIVTDASMGTKESGHYYTTLGCILWHYSSGTGEMNPIAVHSCLPDTPTTAIRRLYPYHGQLMAKPVIGEDPITKYLYVAWVEFPFDIADTNGYEIGEIYCSYSLDGGTSWAPKLNLTMSPENCEVFLSMAPIVDEALRIFYMLDKNNHSNITAEPPGLDPDTCLFQYFEAPIAEGDVEVVSIDVPGTMPTQYTPKAVYKNNGTAPLSFQARFEINVPSSSYLYEDPPESDIFLDTLLATTIFYYDIIDVENLAAGATKTIEFKTWDVDPILNGETLYCSAYGTFLIDTALSNNTKVDSADVAIEENPTDAPTVFTLSESYPNPIEGNASIKYTVPITAQLNIKVYDITGKFVATLVDRSHKPGTYTTNWNRMDSRGDEVPGGIYFYRLTSDKFFATRKIVILR